MLRPLEKDAVDDRSDHLVQAPEIEPDDRARDDDDHDALEGLAAARPVDLLELCVRLADELATRLRLLAAGLLLDRLLCRPDLLLATPAGRGGSCSRSGPCGSPLSPRLARHPFTSSPDAQYVGRTNGSTSGTRPGRASFASTSASDNSAACTRCRRA